MYAFIYNYLNTEYRYISSVILSYVDLVTCSVYGYTKTHSVQIYQYQGLWRASLLLGIFIFCGNFNSLRGIDTRWDKKQIEDIQNKKLANKTKKMNNTELLIHEHTNKSQHITPNTWKYK